MTKRYDFRFKIAPDLYRRAISTPLDPPSTRRVHLRNLFAVVCAVLAIICMNFALFDARTLAPFSAGACLGAILVVLLWWRQHARQLSMHAAYNDTGGEMALSFDPDRVVAARKGIESRVAWGFVRAVRRIEGAILIELPTARLILPEDALPADLTASDLMRQLLDWHAGAAP